jgi:uncharacterized protein
MNLSNLTNDILLVADTGPLLALARIGFLRSLTELFRKIVVTQSVALECLAKPERSDAWAISEAIEAEWLCVVPDPPVRASFAMLDSGEQTVLEYALRHGATVLMDERSGRQIAKSHQIKIIGTVGILLLAKRQGLLLQIKPQLHALLSSGYFLSERLIADILDLADE